MIHIKKTITFTVIFLLIGTILVLPATSTTIKNEIQQNYHTGNILYVGGSGPGNYTTIQEAINASQNKDTIFVYNNIYYEHLIIGKDINLIGEDNKKTIIDAQGTGRAVQLSGYINFSGFTLRNAEFGILNFYQPPPDDNYIFNVHNNIITNNNVGIALSGTFKSIIQYNLITNNQQGITFFNADDYQVYNNTFIDNDRHAFFEYVVVLQFLPRIKWKGNYWDDWQLRLPHLIQGDKVILFVMRPGWVTKAKICTWYNIDWHPTKEPYNI